MLQKFSWGYQIDRHFAREPLYMRITEETQTYCNRYFRAIDSCRVGTFINFSEWFSNFGAKIGYNKLWSPRDAQVQCLTQETAVDLKPPQNFTCILYVRRELCAVNYKIFYTHHSLNAF